MAGSVSGGAKSLNMSQPPLSKMIHELEEHLGVALFERSSRGMSLTEAGKSLLYEARLILRRNSEAVHLVRRVGRGEVGELRVGVLGWLLWGDLPDLFASYSQRHPDVRLNLQDFAPAQQIEMLAEGRLDIGINRVFGAQEDQPDLESQILRGDELYAVIQSEHALAKRCKVSLHDLQALSLITMAEQVSDFAHTVILAHHALGISPTISHRTQELHSALALVSSGLGYAVFPGTLNRIPWPGLRFIPIVESLPQLELRVFWTRTQHSAASERFVEFLITHYEGDSTDVI